MDGKTRHVVVVCGYGCHLFDADGDPTPLILYLNRVVEFVSIVETVDHIFLCGGRTQQKSAPGVSESGLMYRYLIHELALDTISFRGRDKDLFILEERSYTTFYNIAYAAEQIRSKIWNINPDEKVKITIFCEAQRSPNVIQLARHFMIDLVETIDDISVETASWERADPFKQVRNLIYNRLAIKYPWLGLAEREQRKRIQRSYHI